MFCKCCFFDEPLIGVKIPSCILNKIDLALSYNNLAIEVLDKFPFLLPDEELSLSHYLTQRIKGL